jgi:hypothetical protein
LKEEEYDPRAGAILRGKELTIKDESEEANFILISSGHYLSNTYLVKLFTDDDMYLA